MPGGGSTTTPIDHAVSFYADDAELLTEVAAFVRSGLEVGERVIVVASAPHGARLDDVLLGTGCDAAEERSRGRLTSLDAAELLRSFAPDGIPEPERFSAVVGELVGAAAAEGSRVRIFGEMVALLWDAGDVASALHLESMWNDLATQRPFSLVCAYGLPVVGGSALEDVHRVCELHSSVLPPRGYDSAARSRVGSFVAALQCSQLFVCLPAAIPAVRRFVATVLADWSLDCLIPDAILVASELATNAIRHARSPFLVTVDRSGPRMRIAVEDLDGPHPAVRAAAGEATSGRGVFIVDGVCESWGSEQLPRGKVVWGDLSIGRAIEAGGASAS